MKDLKYINGLLNNNSSVLNEIYQKYFLIVEQFVLKNNGTTDDAKDVFQDGLMVIYTKAQDKNFELTSSFHTFLYSICRFIWLRKQRKNSKYDSLPENIEELEKVDFALQALIEKRERHKIFTDNFNNLKTFCQRILNAYFSDLSMEEIAIELELKNAHTARNRKYRCQKELEKLISLDERYQELKEENNDK